ncbi:O-antigen ligase family protein [Allochromatium palmeri]|uniref:O-antigen ligase family protein n=1 Tax=Allochromatium palmeri TaxID=231048 RepID=A0A6N8EEI4_9GAMM|nr:O-antigen ligase family protein [Allochromatium palmeri]MTW21309.1 O-antigen ligase family protein [Allochromatium palmeri]
MSSTLDRSVSLATSDGVGRLGLFGLYLFAIFAWLGTTPATLGLGLLTLAFVLHRPDWRSLGRDPVVRLSLVVIGFLIAHSLILAILAPSAERATTILGSGLDWLKLMLFIPLAYWCAGRPERVRRLLLLAALGFSLAVLRKIDWASFGPEFFSTRFESYLPAIAFGMFSGLGALGLIVLRQAFWGRFAAGWPRHLGVILWTLWLLFMLEGLLLSQSRGSWLAFLGALALLVVLEWREHARSIDGPLLARRRRYWLAAFVIAPVLLGGLLAQTETVRQRFSEHTDTLIDIARGETAAVESDPVGLRFKALLFARDTWSERPWFGWGAGTSRELIASSGRREALFDYDHWLPHLHNTYAEILVQFGGVGLILLVALVWALARAGFAARRTGHLPADLGRFYLVALVFVLIWCLFNYRVVRTDWMFFWILVAGTLYGFQTPPTPHAQAGNPMASR